MGREGRRRAQSAPKGFIRMRVLRTLPVLLLLTLARPHGISALINRNRNLAALRRSPPSLLDHGCHRAPQLTPGQSCKGKETVVHCARLVASIPRGGGARVKEALKAKEEGGLKESLRQFSAAERAVAVNAISWAAVVGGTIFWSGKKMSSDEGVS